MKFHANLSSGFRADKCRENDEANRPFLQLFDTSKMFRKIFGLRRKSNQERSGNDRVTKISITSTLG
jgi:hypothetical protein